MKNIKNIFKKMNTEQNETENELTEPAMDNSAQEDAQPVDEKDKQIAELQAKVAELNDKYIRLYSEFDNFRKRTAKEKIDLIQSGGEDLFKSVLPILDDFERAIKSNAETNDVNAVKDGVNLIYNKFKSTLTQKGLAEMNSLGEHFNADIHEAITNNKNVTINHVRDLGPRIGKARDTDPEHRSGFDCSLKIGGLDISVTDYDSNRPDGLMDVLPCQNMTLNRVRGVYDSSFIHDIYPGVRFPFGDYYQNLTLRDVTLTDLSVHPYGNAPAKEKRPLPFTGARGTNNRNIIFENVVVNVKNWSRPETQPEFGGVGNQTHVTFNIGK